MRHIVLPSVEAAVLSVGAVTTNTGDLADDEGVRSLGVQGEAPD